MGAAVPIVGGLALGALGTGLSAMSQARAQRQQQSMMQQAQQQSMMQNMMAMQAQQQRENQMQQMMELDRQQARAKADALKASVGSTEDPSPKGLATTLTSPLGDTTTPSIGNRRLLS